MYRIRLNSIQLYLQAEIDNISLNSIKTTNGNIVNSIKNFFKGSAPVEALAFAA